MNRQVSGRSPSDDSIRAILNANPDSLYRPADLARMVFDYEQEDEYVQLRLRLGKYIRYHAKDCPDGKLGSHRAWLGKTWYSFLDKSDVQRVIDEDAEKTDQEMPSIGQEILHHQSHDDTGYCDEAPSVDETSIPYTRGIGHFPFRTVAVVICAMLLAGFFGASFSDGQFSSLQRILEDQGPEAAADYLETVENMSDQDRLLSGWTFFRANDYARALREIEFVERNVTLKPYVAQLRAFIAFRRGEFDHAEAQFIQSIDGFGAMSILHQGDIRRNLYQDDIRRNIAISQIELAAVWMLDGQLTKSSELLDRVQQDMTSADFTLEDRAYFMAARIRLVASQGDLGHAYELSKQRMSLVEDHAYAVSDASLLDAHTDLGLYSFLVGDADLGWAHTIRANDLAFKIKDKRRDVFLLVNYIALQKCQDSNTQNLLNHIKNQAIALKSFDVAIHADFVSRLDCL